MPLGQHSISLEASTTSSSCNSNTTTSSAGSYFGQNGGGVTGASVNSQAILEHRAVKDPQELFRKSCSMKIAAEEAVEAGDEAEEDEDDDDVKLNRLRGPRGDQIFPEHSVDFDVFLFVPFSFCCILLLLFPSLHYILYLQLMLCLTQLYPHLLSQ